MRGQVAIVTGGGNGIGRALCEQLSAQGAVVYVADIDETAARRAATAINGRALCLDVSDLKQVEGAVTQAATEAGRLDYVFNNAAIAAVGEFRDASISDFRRIMDVNLFGVVHGSTTAYRLMLRQGFGHIVNIASVTGLMPSPILTAYSASKWAIIGFSLALREEAARFAVKVTAACPGLINTDIGERSFYWNVRKEDYLAWLLRWRSRMLSPHKAAAAILRGVARNRAIVVFPFSARLGVGLYNLCPALFRPFWKRLLADFRRIRT